MQLEKKIITTITALLLAAIVTLPAMVQFSHFLDGHQHMACNNQTTHLHSVDLDCQICHFHQAAFNLDISSYPEFSEIILPQHIEKVYTASILSFQKSHKQLRAPPFYIS